MRSARRADVQEEVVRERLGGRVAGKTFFMSDGPSVCIVEVVSDTHEDELGFPLLAWTIVHELGHAILLQAYEDHDDRDLDRLLGDDRTCREAALTACNVVDEMRCDVLAGTFLKQCLSINTGDEDPLPVTAGLLLGEGYGERAVEHLRVTLGPVLDAVWRYRLTGQGLAELWPLAAQHFNEVLVLQAHARATAPDSPALTSPTFLEHPVGQRIDTCWNVIVDAIRDGGELPHADDWASRQRRLAVDGGAAVVELYSTVGITPERQPDGSLYVHVTDPVVPLEEAG